MTKLPEPAPVMAAKASSSAELATHCKNNSPVVLRGLVTGWPAVQAARVSDAALCDYLTEMGGHSAVRAIAAPPSEGGRFFYNTDLTRFNFRAAKGAFGAFLSDLQRAAVMDDAPAMAVQSEPIPAIMPGFIEGNPMPFLPSVEPRIWIGNRIRVAPHYDAKENIACCVAGQRQFTLFPPECIADLYPGPFELTPAGTPVSMVNLDEPDVQRHPRFAEAMFKAQSTTLQPGDAIYIPYGWWHGVESLSPVSMLVNYWWNDARTDLGGPYDALLHAILSLRHLPPEQREVWRGLMDHYVFETNGDPAAHLPDRAKGVIGPIQPGMTEHIRAMIRQALD